MPFANRMNAGASVFESNPNYQAAQIGGRGADGKLKDDIWILPQGSSTADDTNTLSTSSHASMRTLALTHTYSHAYSSPPPTRPLSDPLH